MNNVFESSKGKEPAATPNRSPAPFQGARSLKTIHFKFMDMPIKPENKGRYPKNWKEIRQQILQRANNRCEFCGRENHSIVENEHGKMIKVVLTIAHLNHTPEDCRPENLRALCQRCHNRYDAKHRAETRKNNKK